MFGAECFKKHLTDWMTQKSRELWEFFMQDEVSGTATKQRLPGLLKEWHRWA